MRRLATTCVFSYSTASCASNSPFAASKSSKEIDSSSKRWCNAARSESTSSCGRFGAAAASTSSADGPADASACLRSFLIAAFSCLARSRSRLARPLLLRAGGRSVLLHPCDRGQRRTRRSDPRRGTCSPRLDLREVHKHIFALLAGNEAVALFSVEKLHSTCGHFGPHLRRGSAKAGEPLKRPAYRGLRVHTRTRLVASRITRRR